MKQILTAVFVLLMSNSTFASADQDARRVEFLIEVLNEAILGVDLSVKACETDVHSEACQNVDTTFTREHYILTGMSIELARKVPNNHEGATQKTFDQIRDRFGLAFSRVSGRSCIRSTGNADCGYLVKDEAVFLKAAAQDFVKALKN